MMSREATEAFEWIVRQAWSTSPTMPDGMDEKAEIVRAALADDTELRAALTDLKAWKEAVHDALVINWAFTDEHEDNPRKAVADLIAAEVRIALDPAVSSDAQALIDRGKSEAPKAETYLDQIAEAKRDMEQWPGWMKPEWMKGAAVPPNAEPVESAEAEPVAPGARIVQTVTTCRECPNRMYFSGGVYECRKTRTRLTALDEIPEWCPLPLYTHPPAREAESVVNQQLTTEPVDEEVIAECERIEGRTWWTGGTWLYPGDTVVVRRAAARGKG